MSDVNDLHNAVLQEETAVDALTVDELVEEAKSIAMHFADYGDQRDAEIVRRVVREWLAERGRVDWLDAATRATEKEYHGADIQISGFAHGVSIDHGAWGANEDGVTRAEYCSTSREIRGAIDDAIRTGSTDGR
jgi:hypothetical protein